tara:strand:- start:7006 stop:8013 length:1008 start_codon:yes stop_codon:yes gene_type:complete
MVYVIAEAGVNHNGSLDMAYKLIDIAADAKADAIKFQTFKSSKVVSIDAEKAEYQKETTGNNENQLEMLEKLELSYDEFRLIANKCKDKNIDFISTPFDLDSVDFLDTLGVNMYKIGSGELTNYLLLKRIAEKNKKIILSTGMSSLKEVEDSVNFIRNYNSKEIIVLHCVSCYPTNNNDLNLNCIKTMKHTLNIPVGFSDHTKDDVASLYAICSGAEYIEKHFTIDKELIGPDHRASLNPKELTEFIKKIRDCEIMLGDGVKKCRKTEEENKKVVRRSLFFAKNFKKGYIIQESDFVSLRPYDGICVSNYQKLLGRKLKKKVLKNSYVSYDDFEK